MKFQAVTINVPISNPKFKEIAKEYHVHVNSYSEYSSNRDGFHAYLLSSEVPNYRDLIQEISIENPYAVCVVLTHEHHVDSEFLDNQHLFFLMREAEPTYHQLWGWVSELVASKTGIKKGKIVELAEGEFDLNKETFTKNGIEHQLTAKQGAILKLLLKQRGETVSRITLLETIWNTDKIITDRVLDTNMVALRKIIGDDGRNPRYLQTIFGHGYRLNY